MPQPLARRLRLEVESLEARELLDAGGLTPPAWLLQEAEYKHDRLLVRFDDTANLSLVPGTGLAPGIVLGDAFTGTPGLYEVELHGITVQNALTWFSTQVGIAFAQPDYAITPSAIPNDAQFGNQWGLHNTGQNYGTPGSDIDAAAAWNRFTGTGNMVVAIIDTGISYTHPDLAGNMWQNVDEIAGNGLDDDFNGYIDDVYGYDFVNNDGNPMDDNRHGTHVAGIVGAVGNNSVGVSGVAWDVQLMALKILNASGSGYTSNAIKALNYAVANGAKVVNNSWGGGPYDAALYAAIQNARNQGVIYVAAAGNSRTNIDVTPFYPASYQVDNIVRVAATDNRDNLASFSSYGVQSVQIAAPGNYILSTVLNGGYAYLSGTSMATPMVAGALALVWDQNPTWTYDQVIDRVLDTVDVLPSLATKVSTSGRLNLAAALNNVTPPPPPPPPPADTTGARVTGITALGGTGSLSGFRLTFSEAINAASFTTSQIVSLVRPGGSISGATTTPVAGIQNQFDVTFATQTAPGNYSITVGPQIRDLAGNAMDQNQNGVNGEATADRFTGTVNLAAPGITYSASGLPKAIGDNQTVGSSLAVTVKSIVIADIEVRVDIDHTWVGDLRLRLRGPSGQEVVLMDRRGGSGRDLEQTVFDDQAALSISQGSAPFAGSFRPEVSLAGFNGTNARGYWQLFVEDKATGNVGTLNSWSITFVSNGATIAATSAPQPGKLDQFSGLKRAVARETDALFTSWPVGRREEWLRAIEPSLPWQFTVEQTQRPQRTTQNLLQAFASPTPAGRQVETKLADVLASTLRRMGS